MRTSRLQSFVLRNMVGGIAAQMARRLPGVERDDLEQVLTIWVLEHDDQMHRWFGDGTTFRGDRLTAVALRNEARDYARDLARQQGLPFDEEDEDE